jgi:hypothetical protein
MTGLSALPPTPCTLSTERRREKVARKDGQKNMERKRKEDFCIRHKTQECISPCGMRITLAADGWLNIVSNIEVCDDDEFLEKVAPKIERFEKATFRDIKRRFRKARAELTELNKLAYMARNRAGLIGDRDEWWMLDSIIDATKDAVYELGGDIL